MTASIVALRLLFFAKKRLRCIEIEERLQFPIKLQDALDKYDYLKNTGNKNTNDKTDIFHNKGRGIKANISDSLFSFILVEILINIIIFVLRCIHDPRQEENI